MITFQLYRAEEHIAQGAVFDDDGLTILRQKEPFSSMSETYRTLHTALQNFEKDDNFLHRVKFDHLESIPLQQLLTVMALSVYEDTGSYFYNDATSITWQKEYLFTLTIKHDGSDLVALYHKAYDDEERKSNPEVLFYASDIQEFFTLLDPYQRGLKYPYDCTGMAHITNFEVYLRYSFYHSEYLNRKKR